MPSEYSNQSQLSWFVSLQCYSRIFSESTMSRLATVHTLQRHREAEVKIRLLIELYAAIYMAPPLTAPCSTAAAEREQIEKTTAAPATYLNNYVPDIHTAVVDGNAHKCTFFFCRISES